MAKSKKRTRAKEDSVTIPRDGFIALMLFVIATVLFAVYFLVGAA